MFKRKLATSLALLILLPSLSSALTSDQKALQGLAGVYLLVEGLSPDATRLGLTEDQIKTDVELRLRKAGIRIMKEEEWLKTPGAPYFYVNINTVVEGRACGVSIDLALLETVTLARGFKTKATIWNKSLAGIVGTQNPRMIRDGVGDLLDKFINDYLAVNPK